MGLSTRRKPIKRETQQMVAGAIVARMHEERYCSQMHPKENWITFRQLCSAIDQCGIQPAQLAAAVAVYAGGFTHSVGFYDDKALARFVDNAYATEFVHCLADVENRFRFQGVGTPT